MIQNRLAVLQGLINQFLIYGDCESIEAFGSGHINSTYRSVWNQAGVRVRYTQPPGFDRGSLPGRKTLGAGP